MGVSASVAGAFVAVTAGESVLRAGMCVVLVEEEIDEAELVCVCVCACVSVCVPESVCVCAEVVLVECVLVVVVAGDS